MRSPRGVVKVCVGPSGRTLAHAADFDESCPGGFTLQEAQDLRCRRTLAYAVLDAYANPIVSQSMAQHNVENLLVSLCHNGHTVHTIPIGHEEPEG